VAAHKGISYINLLPKDSFQFSGLGRFLGWATTTGRVLVVLTEFVVLLAFGSRFYFDKKLNDLSEMIDQKQTQILAYADTEKEIRRVLAKQTPISTYLSTNLNYLTKYDNLASSIPSGVELEKLNMDATGLTFSGEANSELNFSQFLSSLKKMENVIRLNMRDTTYDQLSGSVKFSIQITFK